MSRKSTYNYNYMVYIYERQNERNLGVILHDFIMVTNAQSNNTLQLL